MVVLLLVCVLARSELAGTCTPDSRGDIPLEIPPKVRWVWALPAFALHFNSQRTTMCHLIHLPQIPPAAVKGTVSPDEVRNHWIVTVVPVICSIDGISGMEKLLA